MNINDFVRNNTASTLYGASGARAALPSLGGAAKAGLDKANQRIQTQVDSNAAQLSEMGTLKSAVSTLQNSAQVLRKLPNTSTNNENKAAAASFVKAFNDAAAAAQNASKDPGNAAVFQSASRVGKELQRAVSQDAATTTAMAKIGASLDAQGQLRIDNAKWNAAQTSDPAGVRASLVTIGKQLDQTATQSLALSGNVGSTLASLNQKNTVLKSQQATLASFAPPAPSSPFGPFGMGLSAYQNSGA